MLFTSVTPELIPLVVSVIYWPGQPRRVAFLIQEPHE